jgi:hypothetical protein
VFRTYSIKYLADLLEITESDFHRDKKPMILRDFKKELNDSGIKNPDIGLDEDNKVYLVHPQDYTSYVITDLKIFDYI